VRDTEGGFDKWAMREVGPTGRAALTNSGQTAKLYRGSLTQART